MLSPQPRDASVLFLSSITVFSQSKKRLSAFLHEQTKLTSQTWGNESDLYMSRRLLKRKYYIDSKVLTDDCLNLNFVVKIPEMDVRYYYISFNMTLHYNNYLLTEHGYPDSNFIKKERSVNLILTGKSIIIILEHITLSVLKIIICPIHYFKHT